MHAHAIYLYVRLERDNDTKITIYVMRRRPQVHLSPVFGVKKQNCLMAYKTGNDP